MSETSKYIRYLPTALRDQGPGVGADFLDRFLLGFERMLTGLEGETTGPRGVEEILGRIQDYFDPDLAPAPFINWLAGWVGLDLRQEQDWMQDDFGETTATGQLFPFSAPRDTRNRQLIKEIANLYRKRGTRAGLEEYIAVYAGASNVQITEFHEPMQVGVTSIVGSGTIVGERPYYFQVSVRLPAVTPGDLAAFTRSIRKILDREKPAHTYYEFFVEIPTMQIGVASTIGSNSLIGGTVGA